ncbi:MAG: Calvin cycle protein CP12 [Leptolyngbyaceae cyanobacterium bins.59]|nr:Calvin cycle protein CP12 [Leptolyngbyaceae cyanobacterium bins.59]
MTTTNNTAFSSHMAELEDRIQKAVEEAHVITEQYGSTSKESAVAWDTVEELHAEAAHQRASHEGKTAFDDYCEEFPEAPEARIYDN